MALAKKLALSGAALLLVVATVVVFAPTPSVLAQDPVSFTITGTGEEYFIINIEPEPDEWVYSMVSANITHTGDIQRLTHLTAWYRDIVDLTGLEHCTSLTTIELLPMAPILH